MVDEPRRHGATPREHGVGQHRAAAVSAQQGDEDVGAGRHPLAAATASHSASSTGQSDTISRHRSTAASGSTGRSSGGGGISTGPGGSGVAPQRRATTVAATAASSLPGGRRPLGVGDGVGEQPGRQLRWIAAIGAEQPDGDQVVPRVGECRSCRTHAALTKLGSARGPMSIARSSRNTVSGMTPRGVHSTAIVIGRPDDAASRVATESPRADSGAITSEPVSSVSTQSPSARVIAAVTTAGTRSSHGSLASTAPTSSHAPPIVVAALRRRRERSGCSRLDVGDDSHERPLGRARIAVQIGIDDGSDRQRVVERLAVGGERQHHRPGRGAHASQPDPAHLDEILAGVAAAGDQPAVRLGGDCLDVGLAHLPPARHGDTVGEIARQPRHALTGLGEEVEDADLGEHVIVPGGFGADAAGEPTHPVGECGSAGVGESPSDLVPRREAGDARIGEAAAETVFEPAIELDESTRRASRCARRVPGPWVGRLLVAHGGGSLTSAAAGRVPVGRRAPTAAACCSAAGVGGRRASRTRSAVR